MARPRLAQLKPIQRVRIEPILITQCSTQRRISSNPCRTSSTASSDFYCGREGPAQAGPFLYQRGPHSESRQLARRQALKRLQAFGNHMKGLLVDGIDCHLRRAKLTRIIKRADFQDNEWQAGSSRCEMGAAFATKFARHRAFEVGTREFTRFAARVTKALWRHEHEHDRRAAADILAFAAMALRLQARFAVCHVANFTAIASAFEFHG